MTNEFLSLIGQPEGQTVEFNEHFAQPEYTELVLDLAKVKEKGSEKSSEKGSEKTWEKIVRLMRENPNITIKEIAEVVRTSERNVEKHISNLQKKGKIHRVDGDNGGHWEVIDK